MNELVGSGERIGPLYSGQRPGAEASAKLSPLSEQHTPPSSALSEKRDRRLVASSPASGFAVEELYPLLRFGQDRAASTTGPTEKQVSAATPDAFLS